MNKLNKNVKNSLYFVWLIVTVICVTITYYCMKAKATDNYKQILQVAAESCGLEIVEFLTGELIDIDSTPDLGETALHHAARGGCLKIIEILIKKEVDVNAIDQYALQRTALHHASDRGYIEVVRFLLDNGANPNIRGNDGRNPRDMAVIESRHNKDKPYNEIISLLYNAEKQMQSGVVKP